MFAGPTQTLLENPHLFCWKTPVLGQELLHHLQGVCWHGVLEFGQLVHVPLELRKPKEGHGKTWGYHPKHSTCSENIE